MVNICFTGREGDKSIGEKRRLLREGEGEEGGIPL